MSDEKTIAEAVEILAAAKKAILFTGAGISVESGIPPFRGAAGLWSQVNPDFIEIENFTRNPSLCWPLIKKLFYDKWGEAKPNAAHYAAAALQKGGRLDEIITQNIDCLHQRAGARDVLEFHGTLESLVCMGCGLKRPSGELAGYGELPSCPGCGGLLKPDIVFFGEPIPDDVATESFAAARQADVVLVVGASGEVMPAGMIPLTAKERGAKIIEINVEESRLTRRATDVFLRMPASKAMTALAEALKCA